MSTNTANYGLTKPDVTDFYDIAVQNANMEIVDAELKKANDKMDVGANIPVAVAFGSQTYTKATDGSVTADMQVTGMHILNLNGKVGTLSKVGTTAGLADGLIYGNATALSLSNGEQSFTPTGAPSSIRTDGTKSQKTIDGKRYFIKADVKTTDATVTVGLSSNGTLLKNNLHSGSGQYETLYMLITATGVNDFVGAVSWKASGWVPVTIRKESFVSICVDDVPQLAGKTVDQIVAWCLALPYFESLAVVTNPSTTITHADGSKTRTVIEGRFNSWDGTVKLVNGIVIGQKGGREVDLSDADWRYEADAVGFKKIYANGILRNEVAGQGVYIKYDGKPLPIFNADRTASDQVSLQANTHVGLSVADSESGWAETVPPNDDEVKALKKGWKAIANTGTRYNAFVSIVDGSIPPNAVQTTISATTNTTSVTVTSATGIASGDSIAFKDSAGNWVYKLINSIASNVLNFAGTVSVTAGSPLFRVDNGTTQLDLLNYCKANKAPNFTGDKLLYKLATAEPSTAGLEMSKSDARLKGDNPILEKGVNGIVVDNGIYLDEPVTIYKDASFEYINVYQAPLRYKAESIKAIGKNGALDARWYVDNDVLSQYVPIIGKKYASVALGASSPSDSFTADYRRLATEAPNIGTVALSYNTGLLEAIADLQIQNNNKQGKDPSLQTLVDKYMVETVGGTFDVLVSPLRLGGGTYVQIALPITPKASKTPSINSNNIVIVNGLGADVTTLFKPYQFTISDNMLYMEYVSTDSTIYSATWNMYFRNPRVTIDCRKGV